MRLTHVLLTAVNITYVRACVRVYARCYPRTPQTHLRQCRAHLTVVTHARRARHSMNQNKPVPARAGQGDEEEGQGEAREEDRGIGQRGEDADQQTRRLHTH